MLVASFSVFCESIYGEGGGATSCCILNPLKLQLRLLLSAQAGDGHQWSQSEFLPNSIQEVRAFFL